MLSVPVGVVIGLWTAQLGDDYRVFLYVAWQCALFGAGAAVTLLALSLVDSLTNALRVLSVPVGVAVGVWTAQLDWLLCRGYTRCSAPYLVPQPTFVAWQCALFGAGAAFVVLILALAVTRLPRSRARQLKAA